MLFQVLTVGMSPLEPLKILASTKQAAHILIGCVL